MHLDEEIIKRKSSNNLHSNFGGEQKLKKEIIDRTEMKLKVHKDALAILVEEIEIEAPKVLKKKKKGKKGPNYGPN